MEKSFAGKMGPGQAGGLSVALAPDAGRDTLDRRGRLRAAGRQVFGLAAGAAGGWAVLYGQLCPLGLAMVLGLGEDCFAAAAAGAVLAMLGRGLGVRAVCLLCAVGGAVAVRWLCPGRYGPAAGGACALLMGSALCFKGYIGGDGLLFAGADAAVAAALGLALRRFPPERPGAGRLVLLGCFAAALGSFGFAGPAVAGGPLAFNLGLAAAAACALAMACRGGGQNALAGAAAMAAGLCCADVSLAGGAAGLCCGAAFALLPPGDRLVSAALCAAGALSAILAVQPPGAAFGQMASVGAGLLCCLLAPRRLLLRDAAPGDALPAQRPQLSAAATRLNAAAESLSSLADTVNKVYEGLPRRQEGWRWVIDATHDALCANCGRREECWKAEYAVTMAGFEALRPILEEKQQAGTQDLPGQLSRCIHPAALSGTVTRTFALYKSRQEARVHAEAMRTALTEQYSAVAQALSALGDQLGSPGSPEPYKSGRVAAFFTSLGMPPLECAVTLDDLGRTRAAVTLPRARLGQGELAALAGEVGRLCRRSFETPQRLNCRGVTTLLFTEKPLLRAVFGWAGAAARGEVSGDAVQQFCSPTAAQMILCDGMGTGRPAAVDGNLAADLTGRLLRAGFAAELAARLVNVALALKSEEEGGATLDLLSVDLYTGTARVFKAGAAPGFIVHEGKARTVGEAGLPVGVLGDVNGQSRLVRLAAGDVAVLVSDGLLVDGPGWVLKQLELSAAAGDGPEQIARTLVDTARSRADKTGRADDITAAVLRLERY